MPEKEYKLLKEIIQLIDASILNRELHHYILDHINNSLDSKHFRVQITPTTFSIKHKKSKTQFDLDIQKNQDDVIKISTSSISCKGRLIETKEISFIEETVHIVEQEHSTIIEADTREIASIEKNVHKCIYRNNQLSYEYESQNSVDAKLGENRCYAYEKEIFVLENKQMVSRQTVIAEENAFHSGFPTITYGKSSFYDAPNYDTRVHNKGVYIYGSSYATGEDFESVKKEYFEETKKSTKKMTK